VYREGYCCALIGTHHYTGSLTRPEYELVDANRVCSGIHKVRVGPVTRSAVTDANRVCSGIHKVKVGPVTRSAVALITAVLNWNYNPKHMEWCKQLCWAKMRLTK